MGERYRCNAICQKKIAPKGDCRLLANYYHADFLAFSGFLVAAQQAAQQATQIAEAAGRSRYLAVRRQFVDQAWQNFRQVPSCFAWGNAGRLGQFLQMAAAQHLLNLVWRNCLVLAVADPGLYNRAQARTFECAEEAASSTCSLARARTAALQCLQQHWHRSRDQHGFRIIRLLLAAATDCAKYRIQ